MQKRIVSIVSARPNFVKLAAIVHAIEASNRKQKAKNEQLEHVIVHTGQHYDPLLSETFFKELRIPEPNENLGVKGAKTNEDTVQHTRAACIPVFGRIQPDMVIVYGDVAGALGGAQAAHEVGIPVAHVEAGLRSFDAAMPEERNRREIDTLAKLLFVTEQSGVDNLKKEKITGEVHLVGNTMIDTLCHNDKLIDPKLVPIIRDKLSKLHGGRFAIATIHRPSNVDAPEALARVMKFLKEVASVCPIVLPAHPRLQKALASSGFSLEDRGAPLLLIEPLDYFSFVAFMKTSSFILTDSGGIQEEAAFIRKKCFTLRKNTERPCTLEQNGGSNTLIDLEKEEDRQKVLVYAKNPTPVSAKVPKEWDGRAGERIIGVLKEFFAKQ